MSFQERLEERRQAFKKGVDGDDSRRKREEETVQLRKVKRDVQLQKKRMIGLDFEDIENVVPQNANCMSVVGDMAKIVTQLRCGDAATRLSLTADVRRRVSRAYDPPLQEAIQAGIVPIMVQFLNGDDEKLKFEACWVLTNIASGDKSQTKAVVMSGAVPAFINLLGSDTQMETREQSIWALANIAGDSPANRDYVLEANGLPPIISMIVQSEQAGNIKILRNATWALSNLCRGKPTPSIAYIAVAVQYLARLIHCKDSEVLSDALWALSYISQGGEEQVDMIIQVGCLPTIVECISNSDVVQPALRAAGNVAAGTPAQTTALLEANILDHVRPLLATTKKLVRKEALWLISNLTAGTPAQIGVVMDSGFIPRVLEMAVQDDGEVRKEAIWVCANIITGSKREQIEALVEMGGIAALVSTLSFHDAEIVGTCLDALRDILQSGKDNALIYGDKNPYCELIEEQGGLDKLEELQEDENPDVYHKTRDILKAFFECEEDPEDEYKLPFTTSGFDFSTPILA